MKKPSQTLQSDSLKQEILHLEATKTTLQKQAETQRKQIDSDNKEYRRIALEGVEVELTDSRKELATLEAQKKAVKDEIRVLQIRSANDLASIVKQVDNLNNEKDVLEVTNTTLIKENRGLQSRNTVLTDTITKQETQKATINGEITDLNTTKLGLEGDIKTLEDEDEVLRTKLDELGSTFKENKVKWEREISILEAKYNDVAQKIIEERNIQEGVNDNLAKWQTTLEEQDQNLRIREEKLNQDRKVMIRNSNLLNL